MKKWILLSVFAVFLLMLAACNDSQETSEQPQQTGTEVTDNSAYPITVSPTIGSTESEEAGTITFADVTFEKMPERIVVLDYGFLDTLDALGVTGIVGIPKGGGEASGPAYLFEKYGSDDVTDLGTLKSIDFEKVAALEPDVVFISGRQSPFYEELKKITPNVLYIGTDGANYWDSFISSVDKAGQIFNKTEEANQFKAELEAKREEVKAKAGQYSNALVAMYNDKKISGFGANSESRFNYVYNVYGFVPVVENIESSSHGSDFSYESILTVNPEVLFIVDRTTSELDVLKADIENDIIKKTNAYKNGKIVYLDGNNWYFGSNGITIEMAKMQEILDELQ